MADYISREAAFDAVRKVHNPNTARAVMSVVALRELPAADVVEVVRCRDCAIPRNRWNGCPRIGWQIPPDDFFCAFGERKDGDGDD